MFHVHLKFQLKAMPKMFWFFYRSKRDKSEKTSRNKCYVIEKYQPYVHFRFVDQVTRLAIRFRLPKYSQSSKYNLLLFFSPSFLSKLLCSISVCSKATCLVQLGEDWICSMSKMTPIPWVLSCTSVKQRVEA